MIRLLDLLLAIIGLVLLSPIFVILAICIKLESKGPIFYKQERVGLGGIPFLLIKFRSMGLNADKKGLLTVGDRDPRITKVGTFIRKYKLDELAQLFNVVKGDMSFVGPRPEVQKYVSLYSKDQRKILNVRPGITDSASIQFRNENEILSQQKNPEAYYISDIMPKKIDLNMDYIQNPSLFNYLRILWKTALVIITH